MESDNRTHLDIVGSLWAHAALVGALTFIIAATLFVILHVNDPFGGSVSVSDEPFRQVQATFGSPQTNYQKWDTIRQRLDVPCPYERRADRTTRPNATCSRLPA
jgi:hypothetical protein